MLTPITKNGQFFSRFADTIGDGSGTREAIGDYSVVAQNFLFTPPENTFYEVSRMIVQIEDNGNFAADIYGSGTALVNGIQLAKLNSNGDIMVDYMDTINVTTNAQWAELCYDIDLSSFGAGNNFLDIRWTFLASGAPIKLHNESLALILNDDFSFLVSHTFNLQGNF